MLNEKVIKKKIIDQENAAKKRAHKDELKRAAKAAAKDATKATKFELEETKRAGAAMMAYRAEKEARAAEKIAMKTIKENTIAAAKAARELKMAERTAAKAQKLEAKKIKEAALAKKRTKNKDQSADRVVNKRGKCEGEVDEKAKVSSKRVVSATTAEETSGATKRRKLAITSRVRQDVACEAVEDIEFTEISLHLRDSNPGESRYSNLIFFEYIGPFPNRNTSSSPYRASGRRAFSVSLMVSL